MLHTMRKYATTRRGMFTQSGKRAVVTSRGIREQDLQKQVTLTKSQLRDLRMSHETNQAKLLDQSQRQGTHNMLPCLEPTLRLRH